jgi:hypothetical protein
VKCGAEHAFLSARKRRRRVKLGNPGINRT